MSGVEALYTVLLIVALLLNGIAIAGATPMRWLLAPLRDVRTITLIALLDLVLVPSVVVGTATLLDVDPVTRAGLVIVAAASCGPIGLALTRVVRGDVPTSVTLVLGLGALNVLSVPLITTLLLPEGLTIPVPSLVSSLLGLAILPLALGRIVARLLARSRASADRTRRVVRLAGRVSDVSLTGAVGTALLLEPRAVLDVLTGPVLLVATLAMVTVVLAARAITGDRAVRRTIGVTINARAVGLALAVVTLHLADVEGLRAVVLAYGGLTQAVPTLVALGARRFRAGAADGTTVASG